MLIDRRQFVAGAAGTIAFAALPFRSLLAATTAPLSQLFDRLTEAQLRRSPETATQLGLDKGANADLRAKLSDQSAAGIASSKTETKAELAQLEAIDRKTLSTEQQVDL